MISKYAAMDRQIVQVRTALGWAGAMLLVGGIAGCAVTGPTTRNAVEAQAKRLEANGSYHQAAAAWAKLADSSRGATQAVAQLNAAEDYEKAEDLAAAWTAAAALDIPALPAGRQAEGALTQARLALATHRPQQALNALASAPPLQNAAMQSNWLALAGRAHFDAGEPAAGLHALIKRGALLASKPQESLTNSEMLWEYLKASPQLPSADGFDTVGQGWIALAQIWRTAWEEPKQFSSQLSDWQSLYPDHPANQGLIAEIAAEEKARLSYPSRIALLLPLSGPNAAQAQAVQAGILAAYYQGNDTQASINVYDTTGSATGARQALAKASAAGAQFVLGPLTVAGVQGVVSEQSNIPELALNYLPGNNNTAASGSFFQFGLSPEQEARTSAEQAVAQGLSRAVVIVPDNNWGNGIAAAFTRSLTDLGGRVLASATIRSGSQEFGPALSSVFGLDASTQREQRLAAVLGQPLGFTPRRRQDIQFVFFAAPYATALLIPPQIDYYHGLGLPIYSISNVYRPGANTPDMNGVYFPVMPWLLAADGAMASTRNQLSHLYPQNWQLFAPLYALGYDSWRLLPLLMHSPDPLAQPVRGVSGSLSMGQGNVIQRRADPARYVNGTAAPVKATAP